MKRFVKIQFPDGKFKTFDMEKLTIYDINVIHTLGGVVVEYINE